ncbi:MAG: RecX family transcriptional regulator [Bacteroidales bacterium]
MIRGTETTDAVRKKIMAWCSKQERCQSDVLEKLKELGVVKQDALDLLKELEDEGFINSRRFAESYIRGKFHYKKWGKTKIKHRLLSKGIDECIIEEIINEVIDEEEYTAMIFEQLRKKNQTITEDDDYKRKALIIRFGQSRGYETEITLRCADKLMSTIYDDNI